jgi:hypothetical protein
VAIARKAEEAAVAKVMKDLQHRLTGAEIRVERAHQQLDEFQRERARESAGGAGSRGPVSWR